jgi:pimeloyl-ACP methyl ester carboxylesterase
MRGNDPEVHEEVLPGGLPCLRFGSGPPLLVLAGLTPHHRVPTGLERSMELRSLRGPADHFTVHLASRRPGLPDGTTVHDLADHVALAIRERFGGPVPVVGTSTGGSVGLQLAVDHPALVDRLVLQCAACRLGEDGRRRQRRLAELTRAGEPRRAWAQLAPAMAGGPLPRAAMAGTMWAVGPWMHPDDPSDLLATIAAEDAFDLTDDLHRVTAPTLVLGGARDGFYSPELFRRTAEGIPAGSLLLDPRGSHMSVIRSRGAAAAMTRFLLAGRAHGDGRQS